MPPGQPRAPTGRSPSTGGRRSASTTRGSRGGSQEPAPATKAPRGRTKTPSKKRDASASREVAPSASDGAASAPGAGTCTTSANGSAREQLVNSMHTGCASMSASEGGVATPLQNTCAPGGDASAAGVDTVEAELLDLDGVLEPTTPVKRGHDNDAEPPHTPSPVTPGTPAEAATPSQDLTEEEIAAARAEAQRPGGVTKLTRFTLPSDLSPPELNPAAVHAAHRKATQIIAMYEYMMFGSTFNVEKKRPLTKLLHTANDILKTGVKIQCVEACFVAILLTQKITAMKRFGVSFESKTPEGKTYKHLVLGVKYDGTYGSLGISRNPGLMSKPLEFPSLSALVKDFIKYYGVDGHTVHHVTFSKPVDANALNLPVFWAYYTVGLLDEEAREEELAKYERRLDSNRCDEPPVKVAPPTGGRSRSAVRGRDSVPRGLSEGPARTPSRGTTPANVAFGTSTSTPRGWPVGAGGGGAGTPNKACSPPRAPSAKVPKATPRGAAAPRDVTSPSGKKREQQQQPPDIIKPPVPPPSTGANGTPSDARSVPADGAGNICAAVDGVASARGEAKVEKVSAVSEVAAAVAVDDKAMGESATERQPQDADTAMNARKTDAPEADASAEQVLLVPTPAAPPPEQNTLCASGSSSSTSTTLDVDLDFANDLEGPQPGVKEPISPLAPAQSGADVNTQATPASVSPRSASRSLLDLTKPARSSPKMKADNRGTTPAVRLLSSASKGTSESAFSHSTADGLRLLSPLGVKASARRTESGAEVHTPVSRVGTDERDDNGPGEGTLHAAAVVTTPLSPGPAMPAPGLPLGPAEEAVGGTTAGSTRSTSTGSSSSVAPKSPPQAPLEPRTATCAGQPTAVDDTDDAHVWSPKAGADAAQTPPTFAGVAAMSAPVGTALHPQAAGAAATAGLVAGTEATRSLADACGGGTASASASVSASFENLGKGKAAANAAQKTPAHAGMAEANGRRASPLRLQSGRGGAPKARAGGAEKAASAGRQPSKGAVSPAATTPQQQPPRAPSLSPLLSCLPLCGLNGSTSADASPRSPAVTAPPASSTAPDTYTAPPPKKDAPASRAPEGAAAAKSTKQQQQPPATGKKEPPSSAHPAPPPYAGDRKQAAAAPKASPKLAFGRALPQAVEGNGSGTGRGAGAGASPPAAAKTPRSPLRVQDASPRRGDVKPHHNQRGGASTSAKPTPNTPNPGTSNAASPQRVRSPASTGTGAAPAGAASGQKSPIRGREGGGGRGHAQVKVQPGLSPLQPRGLLTAPVGTKDRGAGLVLDMSKQRARPASRELTAAAAADIAASEQQRRADVAALEDEKRQFMRMLMRAEGEGAALVRGPHADLTSKTTEMWSQVKTKKEFKKDADYTALQVQEYITEQTAIDYGPARVRRRAPELDGVDSTPPGGAGGNRSRVDAAAAIWQDWERDIDASLAAVGINRKPAPQNDASLPSAFDSAVLRAGGYSSAQGAPRAPGSAHIAPKSVSTPASQAWWAAIASPNTQGAPAAAVHARKAGGHAPSRLHPLSSCLNGMGACRAGYICSTSCEWEVKCGDARTLTRAHVYAHDVRGIRPDSLARVGSQLATHWDRQPRSVKLLPKLDASLEYCEIGLRFRRHTRVVHIVVLSSASAVEVVAKPVASHAPEQRLAELAWRARCTQMLDEPELYLHEADASTLTPGTPYPANMTLKLKSSVFSSIAIQSVHVFVDDDRLGRGFPTAGCEAAATRCARCH